MSEESPFDELETNEKLEALGSLALIDRVRMKKITVHLEDETGDTVSTKDILVQLHEYIMDQLAMNAEAGNATLTKIYPLMAQGTNVTLPLAMHGDIYSAALLMSQQHLRDTLIHEMTIGFYLARFLEKNKLNIHTTEEDVSQEELDRIMRINKASSASALAEMVGGDGREVLKAMLKKGLINKEDLASVGVTDVVDGEDDDSGKQNN